MREVTGIRIWLVEDEDVDVYAEEKFVSVYYVRRRYGGPEEGGWWYDQYIRLKSWEFETEAQAERIRRRLARLYFDDPNIYVLTESKVGENQTKERPVYC